MNAMVCIVSGRCKGTLAKWFSDAVPNVALLAEHGYWYKGPAWGSNPDWACLATVGTEENIARWRGIVLPILEQYQDSTDGSYIRDKKTSVVWDYRDADPDFGAWQAKELMDHLESVLVNDPVDVLWGSCHVEIKPQGIGSAVKAALSCARPGSEPQKGKKKRGHDHLAVYCSTVGQKPSGADYYLEDHDDVVALLGALVTQAPASGSATP
jgi:trehalose 6-phosphate synthase/phosphatase